MALPPERITVKRRLDEEPIEALYLHSKKHQSSAIWTLATNNYDISATPRLVASSSSPRSTQLSNLNTHEVQNPATASARDNRGLQSHNVSTDHDEIVSSRKQPTAISTNRPMRPEHSDPRNRSEPRRFRLSKSPFKVQSPSLVSKPVTKISSKIRANQLAVFIEAEDPTRKKPLLRKSNSGEAAGVQSRDQKQDHTESSAAPRKRPNATVEERKWRDENWSKPTKSSVTIDQSSHRWNYECPELAAKLQKIAFEETDNIAGLRREHNDRHPLKTKPKPPKPRQSTLDRSATKENPDVAMRDTIPTEDTADYVFDTYIRSLTQSQDVVDSSDRFTKSLQGINQSSLGIIVIEDGEEEELWETFGEGIDSDSDWNSEEEDENAEDFYGNDYPEDEVDTDDELGRGAYNYWHHASDDEEFGDEEPDWSDDGKEAL